MRLLLLLWSWLFVFASIGDLLYVDVCWIDGNGDELGFGGDIRV